MASAFGEEGHSANQNAGFQSHDNKKQEDVCHFVVQHNAYKHFSFFYLL